MSSVIRYGRRQISFDVLYASRKTMEIAVYPNTQVVIRAPHDTRSEEIEKRVQKRARWIVRQVDYFRQFQPRTPARQYISGETHLYFGKQYRLKMVQGKIASVKLTRGQFVVTMNGNKSRGFIKKSLETWYLEKANEKFLESVERCIPKFKRMGFNRPKLHIRSMRTRWGSLSKSGNLTLNPVLIQAPRECIDYVITHELSHLKYHDHGAEFYKLLERIMPDWEKMKHRLELALI